MNDERAVEEIVTKFLLNTCRLCPKLSQPAVQAAVLCAARSYDKSRRAIIPRPTRTEGNLLSLFIKIILCLLWCL